MSTIANIAKRAKQIRKAHPGKAWQACIKQASAELKGRKPAKKASKPRKRSISRKTKSVAPARTVTRSGSKAGHKHTVAHLKKQIREKLEHEIGKTYVQREKASTKRAKTKLAKKITALKRDWRKSH